MSFDPSMLAQGIQSYGNPSPSSPMGMQAGGPANAALGVPNAPMQPMPMNGPGMQPPPGPSAQQPPPWLTFANHLRQMAGGQPQGGQPMHNQVMPGQPQAMIGQNHGWGSSPLGHAVLGTAPPPGQQPYQFGGPMVGSAMHGLGGLFGLGAQGMSNRPGMPGNGIP